MSILSFRKADQNDLELTFRWTNDEETRKNSFHTNIISMEEHTEWYLTKIASSNSHIYIFMDENAPIGVLRLDMDQEICEISYSIDKLYRGQGYGKKMLFELEELVKTDKTLSNNLKAEVKLDNIASQRIFEKLNYKVVDKEPDRLIYLKTIGR